MTLLSRQPLRQPAPIVGAYLLRLRGEEAQLRIKPPLGPPLLRQSHLLKQRGKSRGERSGRSPNALLPAKPYHQWGRNPRYSPSLLTLKLRVPSETQTALSAHLRAHLTLFNDRIYVLSCYILIKQDSNLLYIPLFVLSKFIYLYIHLSIKQSLQLLKNALIL